MKGLKSTTNTLASRLTVAVEEALVSSCSINKSLDEIGDALDPDQKLFNVLSKIGYRDIEKVRRVQWILNYDDSQYSTDAETVRLLSDDCQMLFSDGKPIRNSSRWACFVTSQYLPPMDNMDKIPSEWLMEHARFLYETASLSRSVAAKRAKRRSNAIIYFYCNYIWRNIYSPGKGAHPLDSFHMNNNIRDVLLYLADKGDVKAKALIAIFIPTYFNYNKKSRVNAILNGSISFTKKGEFTSIGTESFQSKIMCAEIRLDNKYEIETAFKDLRLFLDIKLENTRYVKTQTTTYGGTTYSTDAFWVRRALYMLLVMQYHFNKVMDVAKDAWKYREFRNLCPEAYNMLQGEVKQFHFLKKLF